MSNYLPSMKRNLAVAMLCEGMGLRPIGRVLECQYETVMKLGRDIGEGYAHLHSKLFVGLAPKRLELDEAWSFVFKKQARLEPGDPEEYGDQYGDQYSYIALDADNKAVISYHVGKRNKASTIGFALDIAARCKSEPQITSDGFGPYIEAIKVAFGPDADYAMLIKEYKAECGVEARARYQPADVVQTKKIVVSGEPEEEDINTAFVERQNLTLRMLTRRFNRLTNAHSKSLRNHRAAMDLYVGYYNFCWMHETLKKTPAMAAGVAKEPWGVDRLVYECELAAKPWEPPPRPGHEKYAEWLIDRQKAKRKGK